MSTKPPATLTISRRTELQKLALRPQDTFGRTRAQVQRVLVEFGLATFIDDKGKTLRARADYPAKCSITPAGRAYLEILKNTKE